MQYPGLSFPGKQHSLLLKEGRRGRTGSQYLLLRNVKQETDSNTTSMVYSASTTALEEGLQICFRVLRCILGKGEAAPLQLVAF